MTDDLFAVLTSRDTPRCQLWSDSDSGLRAVLVVDSWVLGPAAGGIRTRAYPSLAAAVDDAAHLARAMTLKCALGGVDAGGAKVVMLDHPGLDRPRAFARLGRFVSELAGRFITAGDLGTTVDDLDAMASQCPYVHTGEADLSDAVARGLLRCVEALAEHAGKTRSGDRPLAGLRVAIQGCGSIGSAVARTLASAGVALIIADIDRKRADDLATAITTRDATADISVVAPDQVLVADVDIVCPCATGGVLTTAAADRLRAWAVCGAANNILADPAADQRLTERGILHVPDIVASAGAVIDGVGGMIMGLPDRTALIDALGDTARALLAAAADTGTPTDALARERAWARIRAHERRAERPG